MPKKPSKFIVQCPRCRSGRAYSTRPGLRELDARCGHCHNWPSEAARLRALRMAITDAQQALLKIGDISKHNFSYYNLGNVVEDLGKLHAELFSDARADHCAKCGQPRRPDYVHPDGTWSAFFCSCVELSDAEHMAAHNAMLRAMEEV